MQKELIELELKYGSLEVDLPNDEDEKALVKENQERKKEEPETKIEAKTQAPKEEPAPKDESVTEIT